MEEKNTEKVNKKSTSLLAGAAVLGAAGLLVKILGAAFRIPLGNIIGATGMGYYQKAYPIYNLFLTLATAGIPTAIARMVAERRAVGNPKEAHKVFKASFALLFATGLITASILFFGANWIAGTYLETPQAIYCMKAIAPALLFCPLMASFRGYFQGQQNMKPTAISQIIEQLFRVAIGLGLAVMLVPKGIEYAAAGASFGATAGGIFGFIGMLIIYLNRKKSIENELVLSVETSVASYKTIFLEILTIAIPITIGSAVLPIMNAIDMMVVEKRLLAIGYAAAEANSLYGELTGFAQPLINFPQILMQAVSISMVPLVAASFKVGDTDGMQKNIKLGLRYAVAIALPCAIGMSVLAKPILLLLYPSQRASAINAAPCLEILAISVVFLGSVHTLTGILQGVRKQMLPVINLAIGAVCKVLVTYIFTGIPSLNVKGAAFGTLTAYAVAAILDFIAVCKYTNTKFDYVLSFVKPLVSALVMGVCVKLSYSVLSFLGNAVSTVIAIFIGIVVYAVMILITKTISKEELYSIPKLGKIAKRIIK